MENERRLVQVLAPYTYTRLSCFWLCFALSVLFRIWTIAGASHIMMQGSDLDNRRPIKIGVYHTS